ncbi:MAG: LamG domain-containing protein [Polyangiaceae bacterium]
MKLTSLVFPSAALVVALVGCIDVDGIVYDLGEGGTGGAGGAGGAPKTYVDLVMEDQPIGYWRFNEATSAEVQDSSGKGHNAVSVADAGMVERDVLGALLSTDVDAAISLADGAYVVLDPNPYGLSGFAPYSLEGWVEVLAAAQPASIFAWIEQGANTSGVETTLSNTSVHHLRYDGTGTFDDVAETMTSLVDGYHHLVVTFDGADALIYVDGTLVTDLDPPDSVASLPTLGAPLVIGRTQLGTTIQLDELALYDHALPLTRVEAHFACGDHSECL